MSGEALRREIRESAEERAKKLLAEARGKADAILTEAEIAAKQVLARRVQATEKRLEQIERAEESRSRMEGAKSILSLQSRYVEEVFREAEARLKSLPKDDPALYSSILNNFVLEAVEGLEGAHLIVVARSEDRSMMEGILRSLAKKGVGGRPVTFYLSDESLGAAGGVLLHTDDKRTYFVNTLDSRLLRTKTEERARVLDSLRRVG